MILRKKSFIFLRQINYKKNNINEITFKNRLSLRFLIHWKYKGDNINLTNLLNDFGSTSVDYDADANIYDPALKRKSIPEGLTATKVLEKYIDAIGGKSNIDKVKDLTLKASISVQGTTLLLNITYKIPGQYLSEVQMNGQIFQKQVYNNGAGKTSGMQGNKDLQGEELEKLKLEAELIPELKYAELGCTTVLKEISDENGKSAYVIEVTTASGKKTTDYFSAETGLKMKTVSTIDTQMGKSVQTTEVLEYMDVDGVKYPKVFKQSMGPQKFDITINSITTNTGVKDEIFK